MKSKLTLQSQVSAAIKSTVLNIRSPHPFYTYAAWHPDCKKWS